MSTKSVKKIPLKRKVRWTRRNGTEAVGKLVEYWAGGRGEWARIDTGKSKFENARPSQLSLA